MAINFPSIEKIVAKTIADLGEQQTVTVRYASTTPFDASAPWEGPADSPTEVTVQAVVTPFRKEPRGGGIDQSMQMAAIFITGSALTDSPRIGDTVLLRGNEVKIVEVSQTQPGSTSLLWRLVVEL